ncbi:MAG: DUF2442 domain-containing protein [Bacteroidetes bacterium]|nr:DUF2442 domain-containing protein [Bacteroidota bacterium]MCL6098492.1 DUF2442 domain-containing protein [Bacteroidota bacterium]
MKKYYDVRDVRLTADKLTMYIDQKKYEFKLALISSKLKLASEEERNNFKISPSGYGIHWQMIDEDISIDGLLKQKIHSKKKSVLIK